VGAFTEAVLERVCEARARLEAACEAEDVYGVATVLDELDDALRRARKRGIATEDWGERKMNGLPIPPYQAEAEFFRVLGRAVSIRLLELLWEGPMPLRGLRAAIEIESSSLSQRLAVLRGLGMVTATGDGSIVVHELAGGDGVELMRAARRILAVMLGGRQDVLVHLHSAEAGMAAS